MQDFQKKQLENHKEIFSNVKPITTQDGKQAYQETVKPKKDNKIRNFITKLFDIYNKNNKKSNNNNLNTENIIETNIKQMSSTEILNFLNTDEIKLPENSNNNVNIEEKIKQMNSAEILNFLNTNEIKLPENSNNNINIEEKIKQMNSAEIIQFLNTNDLSKNMSKVNLVSSKKNITPESQNKLPRVGRVNNNNKARSI